MALKLSSYIAFVTQAIARAILTRDDFPSFKKMLEIIFAVTMFHPYVFGKNINLMPLLDHKAHLLIFGSK